MGTAIFALALGSNRWSRFGNPEATIAAALAVIGDAIGEVRAVSPVSRTAAMGPSSRAYANAVALVASDEDPPAMLARVKAIERAFGRRRGRRWGARVIDIDLVLWSRGAWSGPGLVVPHPAFRTRAFVLRPLAAVAPDWRDPPGRPAGGRRVRHLLALVDRRRPRP